MTLHSIGLSILVVLKESRYLGVELLFFVNVRSNLSLF